LGVRGRKEKKKEREAGRLRYDDSQNRERRGLSNPKFAHALAVVMNCGRRARGMYQVCARILFRPESDLTGC
jgi:hypothetical protein